MQKNNVIALSWKIFSLGLAGSIHSGEVDKISGQYAPYVMEQMLIVGGMSAEEGAKKLQAKYSVPARFQYKFFTEDQEKKSEYGFLNIQPTAGGNLSCVSSEDEVFVAVSGGDMGIILWDLARIKSTLISGDNPSKMVFSPRAIYLAWESKKFLKKDFTSEGYYNDASKYGKEVNIYDIGAKTKKTFLTKNYVHDICFAHDDRYLVVSDGSGISICDLEDFRTGSNPEIRRCEFEGRSEAIFNLRASKSGHIIGLAGQSEIFLWKKALLPDSKLWTNGGHKPRESMFLAYDGVNYPVTHMEFLDNTTCKLISWGGYFASCKISKVFPKISSFSRMKYFEKNPLLQKILFLSPQKAIAITSQAYRPSTIASASTWKVNEEDRDKKKTTNKEQSNNIHWIISVSEDGIISSTRLPFNTTGNIALSGDGRVMVAEMNGDMSFGFERQPMMKIFYVYRQAASISVPTSLGNSFLDRDDISARKLDESSATQYSSLLTRDSTKSKRRGKRKKKQRPLRKVKTLKLRGV